MVVSAEIIYGNTLGKGGEKLLTEDNLIKELKQGSTSAFSSLIDKYTPYVSTVIFRIIGFKHEDCKELVSDVFWAVWNNRHKLTVGKEKAYIGEIARNKAFTLSEAKKRICLWTRKFFSAEKAPRAMRKARLCPRC